MRRAAWDYVPDVAQDFLLRSDGYRTWKAYSETSHTAADLRRNRLASVAAAAAVRAVRPPRSGAARLRRSSLVLSQDDSMLDRTDLAVVLFAAKVAAFPERVTEADLTSLRAVGLSDSQIVDITLAAAASCFFADAADEMLTTG